MSPVRARTPLRDFVYHSRIARFQNQITERRVPTRSKVYCRRATPLPLHVRPRTSFKSSFFVFRYFCYSRFSRDGLLNKSDIEFSFSGRKRLYIDSMFLTRVTNAESMRQYHVNPKTYRIYDISFILFTVFEHYVIIYA